MKMLVVLLASWLVLARSAPEGPKDDGAEVPPPPSEEELLQREVNLAEDLPFEFVPQEELDPFLSPVGQVEVSDLPILIHGEPQTGGSSAFTPRGRKPPGADCMGGVPCVGRPRYPSNLAGFPPGRPNLSNIDKICAEGRQKAAYGPWNLPHTGHSHLNRQGAALNDLEAGLSQCCQLPQDEKLNCSQAAWEKVLTQFCKQEGAVKTKPHFCCKEPEGEDRFACFANQAPFPAYDKEIQVVNLAEITPALLDLLCGQVALLSKQKHVPALVQNITGPCCQLQGDERTQCAQQEKSQFLTALCNSPKAFWKDSKKCCSPAEEAARVACFDSSYLRNVTLAGPGQPLQPTRPAE